MLTTRSPIVSILQLSWTDDPAANLDTALRMLRKVPEGTNLAVLPEFFLGPPFYFPGRAHLKGLVDQPIPGPATEALGEVAQERGMYILAGTIVERAPEGLYNTSALISDTGEVVAKARKMHRFAAEMVNLLPGNEYCLVDTPFGKLGVCVCSDFWIPEVPRALALQGAQIIAVPAAALRPNLQITRPCIQATAAFNVCYLLLAGAVGVVEGQRGGRLVRIDAAGHSTIAGPEEILASFDDEVGILSAQLDLGHICEQRSVDLSAPRSLYYCLHGRRPELYGSLLKPYCDAVSLEERFSAVLSADKGVPA